MNAQFGGVILIMAVAAILLASVFFIVCKRYEDGIVGNLALCGMVFSSGFILWDAMRKGADFPPPFYCLLIVCVAIFIGRYAYRVVMFHWAGKLGMSKPRDYDSEQTLPMRGVR